MDQSPDKPKRADPSADTVPAPAAGGSAGSSGSREFFVQSSGSDPDPKRIGKYRIHHRLGSGGMGLVYLATRDDDQFNKRVAIKVIKKGMDSEAIVSRFEQERQVLAALNHANIARLLDGGLTDDGRPYFVMEYVEGLPIDDYCDNNRLSIEDRLDLFRTLCNAVHHAHTNLIVHRDLKPGNVIVTPDGTLKLLDFGIAKLLNPSIAVFSSEPTQTFLRLMTPEYASPEQVRGDPISTASDVYSLGVLLYELITGRRPYEFKTRLQNEIERIICNEDPERPSTAITHVPGTKTAASSENPTPAEAVHDSPTRATTVEEIAKVRHVRPDRLRRQIAGDLDNMIMMAMRKEPKRRYSSAEQFAEDIKRHLTGLPVIARPATWHYQFGKFVRRNKGGVGAVAAIIAVLVIGVAATTMQRNRAVAAETAARQSEQAALAAKALSDEIRTFTANSLYALNDEISAFAGSTETRQRILDRASEYLKEFERKVGHSSELRAELADGYTRLGEVQGGLRSNNLGDPAMAMQSFNKAQAIWSSIRNEHPDDVAVARKLALTHVRIGDIHRKQSRFDQAAKEHETALETIRPVAVKHANDLQVQDTLAVVLAGLSDALNETGSKTRARELMNESLQIRQRIFDASPNDPAAERKLTIGLTRLASLLHDEGQREEALKLNLRVFDIRKRLWENDQQNAQRIRDLATAHLFVAQDYRDSGQFENAEAHYRQGIDLMKPMLVADAANARYKTDLANLEAGLASTQQMRQQAGGGNAVP